MFVIIENNSVILGPMKWNRFRFQNVIKEECEIETILPDINNNFEPIIINENIKILPVQSTENPPFNSKIEILNGPFWQFTETHAISSYVVVSKPIESVKNELKSQVANERWKKEISGVKTTIQNIEVTIDTDRATRDIFVQKYLLMNDIDTVMWKFPETWLSLTKSDLGLAVNAGAQFIQDSFEWEANIIFQIESATTLNELDAIVIVEQSSPLGE